MNGRKNVAEPGHYFVRTYGDEFVTVRCGDCPDFEFVERTEDGLKSADERAFSRVRARESHSS